jgi:5-methylcytosine-specific restriction endonuclease McrA
MAAKPEKYKAQRQAWEKADPARNAAKLSRRRTRKAGNGVFVILPKELRKLKTQPCIYCGGKAEHMDHITPISRGGRHSVGNLAPACAKCNLSKKDKFIIEWKVGAF